METDISSNKIDNDSEISSTSNKRPLEVRNQETVKSLHTCNSAKSDNKMKTNRAEMNHITNARRIGVNWIQPDDKHKREHARITFQTQLYNMSETNWIEKDNSNSDFYRDFKFPNTFWFRTTNDSNLLKSATTVMQHVGRNENITHSTQETKSEKSLLFSKPKVSDNANINQKENQFLKIFEKLSISKSSDEDAVSKLTKIHPELTFHSESKIGHQYRVTAIIVKNELETRYCGRGVTYRSARQAAARLALSEIEKETTMTHNCLKDSKSGQDSKASLVQHSIDKSAALLTKPIPELMFSRESNLCKMTKSGTEEDWEVKKRDSTDNRKGICEDHPISELTKLHPELKFQEEGKKNSLIEMAAVIISDGIQTKYLGRGQTRKLAKRAAARAALSQIKTIEWELNHEEEYPISALTKIHPELTFVLDKREQGLFKMIAFIDENGDRISFMGMGKTRKLAKKEAAKIALKHIKVQNLKANNNIVSTQLYNCFENTAVTKAVKSEQLEYPKKSISEASSEQVAAIDAFCFQKQFEIKNTKDFKKPVLQIFDKLESVKENKNIFMKQLVQPEFYLVNKRQGTSSSSEDGSSQSEGKNVEEPQTKRIKVSQTVNLNNKNPVSILNELKPGLIYAVKEQSGPSHAPIFKMTVTLDDQEFVGTGGSKKLAKAKAAEAALKSFLQFPDAEKCSGFQTDTNIDFSSKEGTNKSDTNNKTVQMTPNKGAAMIMNEMFPQAKYMFEENLGDVSNRFKAIIKLNDLEFVGTGSNKKKAKNAAAMVALTKLLAGNPNYDNVIQPLRKTSATNEQQQFADIVGRLVNEKFAVLLKNDPLHMRKKVLAGIVMTKDDAMTEMELICVTTGTKCINGENISSSGAALNDMHAEVIARRCLVNYFYDQMRLQFTHGKAQNSIFEPRPDSTGYRLKEGYRFHLYISTAPCGDARIFSPNENGEAFDKHPGRISRGLIRTKIESGEGTIPIKGEMIQTWDGILQGERLLTMSCSDKIARWNVVGLQGSLLSCFIDPIYLSSIVLGSLLNETHMYRAMCGRIENTLQGLPPPFRLNRPYTCLTASSVTRSPSKAPNFSVNWSIGYQKPEIINTSTGKPDMGVSRLCKWNFAKHFRDLCKRITSIGNVKVQMPKVYADAKQASINYNIAKEQLFKAFIKANLGYWVKKPIEQDQFEIEEEEVPPEL